MTVVVADTSPLSYLALIDQIEVLRLLYGRVLVPPEVLSELSSSGAPPAVAHWVSSQPAWLDVRAPRGGASDAPLLRIGPGERAAILLSEEEPAVLLLIDDAAGRAEASRRGIPVTGTLGVLRTAALRGLLDLPTALTSLTATNFRVSVRLVEELLAEDARRRQEADE